MTRIAVDVAVPIPLHRSFSYSAPAEDAERLRPGVRVRVPFAGRRLVGFVLGPSDLDPSTLKDVEGILDAAPLLGARELELGRRIARRWVCGIGEALAAMIPAGVKKGAGGRAVVVVHAVRPAADEALADWPARASVKQRELLRALVEEPEGVPRQVLERSHRVSASPLETLRRKGLVRFDRERREEDLFGALEIRPTKAPPLNPDQARAAQAIGASIDEDRPGNFLLFGVTGSGKTEVYLDAIGRTLARGRGAVVMVPEISLTPQTVERFESRFGGVAVLHSHLTDADRARQWHELASGARRIAIGPRSAVFAPIPDLGLVILDEEHETSFKQQNAPRYHARDVALMRGELSGATVVLGSATPSLETWELARRGRLQLLRMPERIGGGDLPAVTRIDMRSQRPTGPGGLFSPLLSSMIRRNLDRGEQALLFLNRRGFRTSIRCRSCGYTKVCRDCDVAMTWYRSRDHLLCHHCGRSERTPDRCPECGHGDIHFSGIGTELVEHATRTLFPDARVARIDSETMRARGAHERLFAAVKAREIDILVGTQMIAKGLDFPGITLIGVVAADTSLCIPDFRAAERTFQLMTQVAGRAGRGEHAGRVFVQTYSPDHYALETAARHDYEAYAAIELDHRRGAAYPPFGALARVVAQGPDEGKTDETLAEIARALRADGPAAGVSVLGPAPAPIAYLKRLHRRHLVLRTESEDALVDFLAAHHDTFRNRRGVQILVDCDPVAML
ncbi:MAG: primosomal protein N' [Planctomycetota bacterium]